MVKVFEYYSRAQGLRGQIVALPSWARALILIAALPGVVLIALSLLALLVSILALLLLTVPLYRVLTALVGTATPVDVRDSINPSDLFGRPSDDLTSPGRKKVDVTIIE